MHSPSASTSLIISWSSASVGFCPRDLITVPNSFVVIVPSPSLSNRENASLNSAKRNHTFWCLWGLFTACKWGQFFSKTFRLVHIIFKENKGSKENVQYQYYVQAATILVTTQPIFAVMKLSNNFFEEFLTTVSCISWNLATIAWQPLWNFYVIEWGDFLFFILYYYMRNFGNLIGLEQWYFSLIIIWNTYMWKLQTFAGTSINN